MALADRSHPSDTQNLSQPPICCLALADRSHPSDTQNLSQPPICCLALADRSPPSDTQTGITMTSIDGMALAPISPLSGRGTTQPSQIDVAFLQGIFREITKDELHNISFSPAPTENPYSIYKIPYEIRKHDDSAYKPKVVGIGPYHRLDSKDMEDCKWRCFQFLISQRQQNRPNTDLASHTRSLFRQCLAKMLKNESKIKSYYYDEIGKTAGMDLAKMMVLDGCFILYLLLKLNTKDVAGRLWMWTWELVKYDLLLLENQIPFFVLKKLLKILRIEENTKDDLVRRAICYFEGINLPRNKNFVSTTNHPVHHLLHLFYLSLLPSPSSLPKTQPHQSETPVWIPCATELTEFGVMFNRLNKKESFLDVNFTRKGEMEIPTLQLDDHSKDLFRNLIAFEQCHRDTKCHITVYTNFMDCIISSEKDTRLLQLKNILINRMNVDQELTHFFSRLNTGIHFAKDRFYLSNLFRDVRSFQEDKWNKSLVDFKRAYCSNTWAVFATVVGVIFFLLTIAQTFYTIYPYYKPGH